MNEDTAFLHEMKAQIMAQGYDALTAAKYAGLIGDTPVLDERGNVLVHDGEKVVAVLKPLPFFREI